MVAFQYSFFFDKDDINQPKKRLMSRDQSSPALTNPTDVLAEARKQQDMNAIEKLNIVVNSSSTKDKQILKESTGGSKTKQKSKPVVKKGFLLDPSVTLYPDGSEEGRGGNVGGAYARVMSKCQIVNVNSAGDMKKVGGRCVGGR